MKKTISTVGFLAMILGIVPTATATLDSNSIIEDGIEYYIQTDKAIYDLGEDVNILYRVSNLTDVAVDLGDLFSDAPDDYDLRIMQGDDNIWWDPDTNYSMWILEFILQPLETREFQTVWNMMNENGTPWPGQSDDDFLITPGTYDVVGEVALLAVEERATVSVSIDVIPEPATILLLGFGGLFLKRGRK